MQGKLQAAQQAAEEAQSALTHQRQELEQLRQGREVLQKSLGLRDTALKALRQEVDDVLRADAEKAESLEEVIEELERLQQSEADKDRQLQSSRDAVQVGFNWSSTGCCWSCGSCLMRGKGRDCKHVAKDTKTRNSGLLDF